MNVGHSRSSTGKEIRLSSRLSMMHLAASAVLVCVIVLGTFWLSVEHDRQAASGAGKMVDTKIASFEEQLRATNRDYSVWTEAYRAILGNDMDWLYSNIGTGAAEIGALDLIVLVPPGDVAPFGWRAGSPEGGETDLLPAELVEAMLAMLRGTSAAEKLVRSAYAFVDGDLWLLTVTRVTPIDGVPVGVADAAIPRQIQGVRIASQLLEDIRAAFILQDVEIAGTIPSGRQGHQLDLINTDESVAIVWKAPTPGRQILARAALPVSLVVLAFGAVALLINRYAVSAARRLEAALVDARAAERAKSDFLGVVSHELRTPMNGILGLGQLLTGTELNASQHELLSTMMTCAQSQMRMIETLLDVTAIENGKRALEASEFNLSGLVRQIGGVAEIACEKKGLSLKIIDETDPAIVLLGDGHAVCQIVTNLVENAVKFTNQGGVTIRAEALPGSHGNVNLRIGVTDTGVGIDPADHARIFERLTQLDETSTRAVDGLGLGLSICRSLAEMMGGRIELESTLGKGSTFTLVLSLPRASASLMLKAA